MYSRKRAKRVSSPAVWDEDQGRHESNLETQCRRTLRGMGRGMLRELVEGLGRPPRVAEDLSVTDRINHDLVKSEGMPEEGVGDAHSSDDDWDSITQSELRGVTLFERPKRVRGANALRG